MSPYLPAVVPGLKKSLLDPSPEVRAVSSRALGATVRGMGEECFNDLMPWLLETLTSDISSVDRSGAAQGNFSLRDYNLITFLTFSFVFLCILLHGELNATFWICL